MRDKRVYIAAAYGGKGENVALNVRNAIWAGERVLQETTDWLPYVPHLFHLWQLVNPHPYDFWMRMDDDWMRTCHALVRTIGTDGTVADADLALERGLPVFLSLDEFIAWTKE